MYVFKQKKNDSFRLLLLGTAALLILFGLGVALLRSWYSANLRPVSMSLKTQYFTVQSGQTVRQIGDNLQRGGLIRSANAFETYVRGHDFHDKIQAGTYVLSPSLSVQEIVSKMVNGDVAKNLLTILPAKRLDEIEKVFAKAGYSQAEIDQAFNINTYKGHPLMANLPAGASLEGFLYPDSFQKDSNTSAATIVRESLDEMQKNLNTDITSGFAAQGLSVYQGVTLASIVEQETGDIDVQPTVAQVFLLRIKQAMNLQSNVTANYAADIAGQARNVNINSPYNTYLHPGLPPGPIGSVTIGSLRAVAHPATTTYLYFVAGDDGTVHFSHTQAEHDAAVAQYCKTKCQQ